MIPKIVFKSPSVVSRVATWAWVCVCGGLMAANLLPSFVPHLSNDSYQYLSVADNTLSGHFGCTSLVFYDPERSFGVIPAPMVHFPLGYPLACAVIGLMGVPLETAATLVSAFSTMACVLLLAWLVVQLGLSRLLGSIVVGGFVLNGRVIYGGASILSEAFFTFVLLSGVALLVAARRREEATHWGWRWAAAGFAFGATYWVRYAGLFFVLGLVVLAIRHLVLPNRPHAKGYAIAVIVAAAVVLAGIVRNLLLIGSWQETINEVNHPLWGVLAETARAGKNLFLGPTYDMPAWTSLLRVLIITFFVVGAAGLAWVGFRHWPARANSLPATRAILIELLILVLAYCGCMFYAGLTTNITYNFRMFLPLTPLLWLMAGLVLNRVLQMAAQGKANHRPATLALGASFACYVALNLVMVVRPPTDQAFPSIHGLLDPNSSEGNLARAAILELAGPTQVIVANDGQAVGHVLNRPTIGLAESQYSRIEWNEKAIRDVIRQYDAVALVIYSADRLLPSPFVRDLAHGEAPSWIKLAYRSSDVLVYRPAFSTVNSNEVATNRTGPEQSESGSR